MSNQRIFIRCKACGREKFLAKRSMSAFHTVYSMRNDKWDEWFKEHEWGFCDPSGNKHDLDIFELVYEHPIIEEVGLKFDKDKIRFELIPPEVEKAFATILTYGAKKYGDRNWELGIDWSRVYGAMQRHLHDWKMGEKIDKESGHPHLWHALACLSFLVTYEMRNVGYDNLTKTPPLPE